LRKYDLVQNEEAKETEENPERDSHIYSPNGKEQNPGPSPCKQSKEKNGHLKKRWWIINIGEKNKPSSKSHIIHTNQIHMHCRSNVKGNMIKYFFNGISSESWLTEVFLYGCKESTN